MSETNEAKEPGQTLFEASGLSVEWSDLFDIDKAEWAKNERVARDAFAPRLATLEAETRDLHRKLSESRVEAQAQRAGRVEAEHRLGLLVNEAGRRVLAIRSRKLVKKLRKRIAELEAFGGSQTDAAMKGAQEVATLTERAEKAERERDREREEAMKTMTYLQRRVDEERALRESAIACRDSARGALDMLEHERNAARRERDEARAEVARLTAHLNPRPDAGLAGLAEREAVAEAKAERRPPFRDWTDEARAKLVPGASVMWHCLISACEPRTYGTPRRIVVREVCADDHPLSSGYVVIPDGPPDREVNLSGCDPATIEPPATQDEPVRPPAPDLRRGDRVKMLPTFGAKALRITQEPFWSHAAGAWEVFVDDSGRCFVRDLDLSTRVRTWQPGEVVPHAPLSVEREKVGTPDHDTTIAAWWRSCPLAEPWTQTGI